MRRNTRLQYETTNYYACLNVAVGANAADIKRHYRNLAIQWHPDKHPEGASRAKATEIFQKLSEAYEVLGDAESRRSYDVVWSQTHRGRSSVPEFARNATQRASSVDRGSSAEPMPRGNSASTYDDGARSTPLNRRGYSPPRGAGYNGFSSAPRSDPPRSDPPKRSTARMSVGELRRQKMNEERAQDKKKSQAREEEFQYSQAEQIRKEKAEREFLERQAERRRAWERLNRPADDSPSPERRAPSPPRPAEPPPAAPDTRQAQRETTSTSFGDDVWQRRGGTAQAPPRSKLEAAAGRTKLEERQASGRGVSPPMRGRPLDERRQDSSDSDDMFPRPKPTSKALKKPVCNISGQWLFTNQADKSFVYEFRHGYGESLFSGRQLKANNVALHDPLKIRGTIEGTRMVWSFIKSGIRCEATVDQPGTCIFDGKYWASDGRELGSFEGKRSSKISKPEKPQDVSEDEESVSAPVAKPRPKQRAQDVKTLPSPPLEAQNESSVWNTFSGIFSSSPAESPPEQQPVARAAAPQEQKRVATAPTQEGGWGFFSGIGGNWFSDSSNVQAEAKPTLAPTRCPRCGAVPRGSAPNFCWNCEHVFTETLPPRI